MQQSWVCMKESIEGMIDLEEELPTIGEDTILKEKAINYVRVLFIVESYIDTTLLGLGCCLPN